jgi:hypothetical protein
MLEVDTFLTALDVMVDDLCQIHQTERIRPGPDVSLYAGRSVRQEHMHFVRFQDGKAIEHWRLRDELGIMQQLGVIPEPGQPGEPEPSYVAPIHWSTWRNCLINR